MDGITAPDRSRGNDAGPLCIWVLSDGRIGHLRQAQGVQAGLIQLGVPVDWHEIPVHDVSMGQLGRPLQKLLHLPAPDWIIAVGHRTHIALLILKKIFPEALGVVILKPSWPMGWFDAVVVPVHDRIRPHSHVLKIAGILNPFHDQQRHDPTQGLFLIGGPSRRHGWDSRAVWQQIAAVVRDHPQIRRWQLSTSLRTPKDFLEYAPVNWGKKSENFQMVDGTQVAASWLDEHLQQAGSVWVTADSVSMQAEAHSAGCAVQTLEVPVRKRIRDWFGRSGQKETSIKVSPSSFAEQATVNRQVAEWLWGRCRSRFLA